jgi:ketosteroid isomerase-like protein
MNKRTDSKTFSLLAAARAYAEAKSRGDVDGALACCTEDFLLETFPFGTRSRGQAETRWDLERFYELFPDYAFVTQSAATSDDANTVVLTGYARMHTSGRLPAAFGLGTRWSLPRRAIEVPAVVVLEGRNGKLAREGFYFDMHDFCVQLGVPAWLVRRLNARLERRRYGALYQAGGEGAFRAVQRRVLAWFGASFRAS